MKSIQILASEYQQGVYTKKEFIDMMHQHHNLLYEYAEHISGTNIKKIEITDSTIVMITREPEIKLLCDYKDKRIAPIEMLNFGSYEKDCMDMMLRLIKPNHTVFDIGANIGWYSMVFCKCLDGLHVCSFEPMPKTFEYLSRNIELNDIHTIESFNFGFSNEQRDMIFYYDREDSVNSSMANLVEKEQIQRVICKVTTIDLFVETENKKVDFIKCDVEGAELFVFLGGARTLKRYKPIVFSEMLRKWSAKFDYHPNEIIAFMKELGYRCFTIAGGTLLEFFEMDDGTRETNFVFLHKENHAIEIAEFCRT